MKADMPLRSNRSAGAWFFVGSGREKPQDTPGVQNSDVNFARALFLRR